MSAEAQPDAGQYVRLGELYLAAGDSVGAERTWRAALVRDPYSFGAHNNLGRLYHGLKSRLQERQHLEFVVRYFPDYDAGAYLLLADVYRQVGEPRAAARVLRKGRRVFPEDAQLQRQARAD